MSVTACDWIYVAQGRYVTLGRTRRSAPTTGTRAVTSLADW